MWVSWRNQGKYPPEKHSLFRLFREQVKRIEALARSPVYSLFSTSLSGLTTLRAHTGRDRFNAVMEKALASKQTELGDISRFGWVCFLISLGGQAPHVLRAHTWAHMGHTRGGPNEIELTAAHGSVYRPLAGHARARLPRVHRRLTLVRVPPRLHGHVRVVKKSGNVFCRVGIFPDFVGRSGTTRAEGPHVGPHSTCGEPNEIELTAMGVMLNGSLAGL